MSIRDAALEGDMKFKVLSHHEEEKLSVSEKKEWIFAETLVMREEDKNYNLVEYLRRNVEIKE